jgi:outer membrane protein assembly factor BamB
VAHGAAGLARAWPPGGPKVLWKVPVGEGYGGAAIHGDSVFILDRVGDTGDALRRIRLADGKELWRYAYDAPGKYAHGGSRSTPATDGNLVYSIGPYGHVIAVRFADGVLAWKADLLGDWGAKRPHWCVSSSPLLMEERMIVMPWGAKAALVAYDKKTGAVLWTTPNPKAIDQEYQSPVPMTYDGREMVLAAGKQGYLIGADARTGRLLWECEAFPKGNFWHIVSPLPIEGGRIFMTSGYKRGSVMLALRALSEEEKRKPERRDREYKVVELWRNQNMGSHCAQVLYYKGYLYGNSFDVGGGPSAALSGGLRCLTLDGKIVWDSAAQKRRFDLGSLLIADGLVYIQQGKTGELVMAEATPEGYRELGAALFLDPGENWAALALKDGKLLVRDQAHRLACVEVGAGR